MQKYTLIGHPLGHSMSPFIHSQLFSLTGSEAEYTCTDIQPETLSNRITELKQLRGYNITIPYKTEIIKFIDKLDDTAKRYNSVNCVLNHNGISVGYNTDCFGFLKSVSDLGLSEHVLLIGCGGVGRMMAIEAALYGAELTIAIIPQAKAAADILVQEIHSCAPDCRVHIISSAEITGHFDLLLNATPVGMYPNTDACAVSPDVIENCSNVFDAVYNPVHTKLVATALSMGKTARGGTAMLVYQAAKAHEIWNNTLYTEDQLNNIVSQTNAKIEGDFR